MAQNSVLITKWGTGSNASPTTLYTGELAINVDNGTLFYGSASVVKTITASYAITAAFALNGGGGGTGTPGGSVNDFQYNAGGGNFGGASSLTYVSATQIKASGSFTGSFVGNLTGTSSYVSGSVFTSNNLALSSSYAITASYALNAGGTPGGLNTQIQFNSSSTFSGSNSFAYIYASESLQQGQTTLAVGTYSHAEGSITQAIGDYSHAEGDNTRAVGNYSHAEGQETIASGSYSHAEGYLAIAQGDRSHAEGSTTLASGSYSHAEGGGTSAIGEYSHAEGANTTANGDYSHAEGTDTIADGDFSHAEGRSTTATGYASHAEGFGAQAQGDYSHAEGYYTVASGSYQHVQGQYNISSSAQSAFIIGNGVDDNNRSNLVFASGSTFQITGSLHVTQSHISTVDYIDYTVDPGTLAHSEGRTYWDKDRKTLQIDTDVNNFTISAGHVSVLRGRNTNTYTLTKGTVVYINGNSGQFATFTSASWENDPNSAYTVGIIAQDIATNQFGYAVTDGEITGVNTNGFAPATLLYLSSSGRYTGTKPVAPNHTVRLGQVVVASTNGILQVKIDNGYELGELHDVLDNTTTSSYGDLLVKSGSLWIDSKQLTGSYALTGSLTFTSGGVTGSLFGTSSWAVSSSRAVTASYVNLLAGPNITINYQSNGIAITGSGGGSTNTNLLSGSIDVTLNGNGGVITTGIKGGFTRIPYNGTIYGWDIFSTDANGAALNSTIVLEFWDDSYGNFPPTSADNIFTSNKPTLTNQSKNTTSGLSIPVTAGDVIGCYVSQSVGAYYVNVSLKVIKS